MYDARLTGLIMIPLAVLFFVNVVNQAFYQECSCQPAAGQNKHPARRKQPEMSLLYYSAVPVWPDCCGCTVCVAYCYY